MNTKHFLYLSFFILLSTLCQSQNTDKIQWLSFDEAIEKQKVQKKPMLVYIYFTECANCGKKIGGSHGVSTVVGGACAWCKQMEKKTWSDAKVIREANEHFYMVKLDASSQKPITFAGQDFLSIPIPNPENKPLLLSRIHSLANSLLNGQHSFPSCTFLTSEVKLILRKPGFSLPNEMLKTMQFISTNAYTNTTWEKFKKQDSPK